MDCCFIFFLGYFLKLLLFLIYELITSFKQFPALSWIYLKFFCCLVSLFLLITFLSYNKRLFSRTMYPWKRAFHAARNQ